MFVVVQNSDNSLLSVVPFLSYKIVIYSIKRSSLAVTLIDEIWISHSERTPSDRNETIFCHSNSRVKFFCFLSRTGLIQD